MPFIEIGFNAKRPLILGRGGFGIQLNDWLMDEGWGSADFLDDNAPDAVGGLRDYLDPRHPAQGTPFLCGTGRQRPAGTAAAKAGGCGLRHTGVYQ